MKDDQILRILRKTETLAAEFWEMAEAGTLPEETFDLGFDFGATAQALQILIGEESAYVLAAATDALLYSLAPDGTKAPSVREKHWAIWQARHAVMLLEELGQQVSESNAALVLWNEGLEAANA